MGQPRRFRVEPEPERGRLHDVATGIRRMVADNASPMTYHGTNTYLIDAPEGVYVLDPGPADDDRHIDAIVSALDGQGAGIVITHHHSDHFGAVPRLRRLTGLLTFAHADFADDTFRPDVPLADGDIVADLTVLHTPGHASDHLCLRRGDGVMFTGDHVMAWNSSIVMLPDGDMAAYCDQLERLTNVESSLFLPGHGPSLPHPTGYVRKLLHSRRARENEISAWITDASMSVHDLSSILYRKTDPLLALAAERNIEAHLEKLLKEGRAIRQGDRWRAA